LLDGKEGAVSVWRRGRKEKKKKAKKNEWKQKFDLTKKKNKYHRSPFVFSLLCRLLHEKSQKVAFPMEWVSQAPMVNRANPAASVAVFPVFLWREKMPNPRPRAATPTGLREKNKKQKKKHNNEEGREKNGTLDGGVLGFACAGAAPLGMLRWHSPSSGGSGISV
jgi:hypothetical protein